MNKVNELTKHKQGGLWWGRVKLAAVLVIINLMILLLGALAIFPTQVHRDTMERLSEIDQNSSRYENGRIVNSDEYTSLADSPEARYVTFASSAVSFVSFILSIVIVGFSYNYLRKRRIAGATNAVGVTVLVNAVAAIVAWALAKPITPMISGIPVVNPLSLVFELSFVTIFSLVVFWAAAYIFHRLYSNKHSMVV